MSSEIELDEVQQEAIEDDVEATTEDNYIEHLVNLSNLPNTPGQAPRSKYVSYFCSQMNAKLNINIQIDSQKNSRKDLLLQVLNTATPNSSIFNQALTAFCNLPQKPGEKEYRNLTAVSDGTISGENIYKILPYIKAADTSFFYSKLPEKVKTNFVNYLHKSVSTDNILGLEDVLQSEHRGVFEEINKKISADLISDSNAGNFNNVLKFCAMKGKLKPNSLSVLTALNCAAENKNETVLNAIRSMVSIPSELQLENDFSVLKPAVVQPTRTRSVFIQKYDVLPQPVPAEVTPSPVTGDTAPQSEVAKPVMLEEARVAAKAPTEPQAQDAQIVSIKTIDETNVAINELIEQLNKRIDKWKITQQTSGVTNLLTNKLTGATTINKLLNEFKNKNNQTLSVEKFIERKNELITAVANLENKHELGTHRIESIFRKRAKITYTIRGEMV